jgi:putative nucleotidyltransferase with HDIG domain
MDAKRLYYQEINKIQDKDILNFTIYAANNAAPEFYQVPCSSSGRFHPVEDNGKQGLLRHLIKASTVAEQFARRSMFNQYEIDMARSATLLHDICKNGHPWGKYTDYRHGIIAVEFLKVFPLNNDTTRKIITDAIRYHMTPWNTTLTPEKRLIMTYQNSKDENQIKEYQTLAFSAKELQMELEERTRGMTPHHIIEKCIQEADFWASRENMSFFPGVPIDLSQRHDGLCL